MSIRILGTNEIPEASKLIRKQWGDLYGAFFADEAETLIQQPSNAVYGNFSDDGSLQGLGMVTKDQIDYALWGITWLVVSEKERERGIGSKILSTLEEYAVINQNDYPTNDCLVLLTTTMPGFYIKRGYKVVSKWQNTELMIKNLRK